VDRALAESRAIRTLIQLRARPVCGVPTDDSSQTPPTEVT